MNHQDLNTIIIGKPKKKSGERNIIPKNNGPDLHSIKIENETENFQIKKVPNALAKEIMSIHNLKKITQKDLAIKLNVTKDVINNIENGRAIYDGKTKQLINKIQNIMGIKFNNKNK